MIDFRSVFWLNVRPLDLYSWSFILLRQVLSMESLERLLKSESLNFHQFSESTTEIVDCCATCMLLCKTDYLKVKPIFLQRPFLAADWLESIKEKVMGSRWLQWQTTWQFFMHFAPFLLFGVRIPRIDDTFYVIFWSVWIFANSCSFIFFIISVSHFSALYYVSAKNRKHLTFLWFLPIRAFTGNVQIGCDQKRLNIFPYYIKFDDETSHIAVIQLITGWGRLLPQSL